MIGGWRQPSDYWHDKTYDEQSIDFGRVVIQAKEGKVCRIMLDIEPKAIVMRASSDDLLGKRVIDVINGKSNHPIPLFLAGATSLQEEVWQALLDIPYGKTQSYSDIAKSVSRPKAVRAIGTMIRLNPCPILVPCHRVIAKNGTIGGYAYSVEKKKMLLRREGVGIY